MKPILSKVIIRFSMLLVMMLLLIFVPADTFRYWQAWVFAAILIVPMIFVLIYFFKHDPEFLARRVQFKEREKQQKWVVGLTTPVFLAAFLVPGLDHRFSWSAVPTGLVIAADICILLGYLMIFSVFRQNRYASRIVEVSNDQQVITTGWYGVVRHPMYLGVMIMYIPMPLALGSWWGLIPVAILPIVLVFRIINEEKVLTESLPGYGDYCRQTRYRVLPGVW
jgi:protein-S-isoprenylcysteine O-methyltransferase Ste14